MIHSPTADGVAMTPGENRPWLQYGIIAAACALVIGVYAYTAHSGYLVSSSLNTGEAYYNLLVQGFRAGQLNVKKEVPPGLAQLADPYDRAANSPYGLLDLSYYRGKLYLYFGPTPVLVLFWPYVALTGHYLLQKDAVVTFCLVGFLASACLLWECWRRYFKAVSVGVVATVTLALGLATFTPYLLARCDIYEVSISCGYAFTMLALAAIWKAFHEPEQRGRWLTAASLSYGLAVGSRPSLLPGAVILLVPVIQAWRDRRKVWNLLMAAIGPIVIIGLGLMVYNTLRFDDPFEFGLRYQLAADTRTTSRSFGLQYLWFNLRVYFLEPAHWSRRFPFVHDITAPPFPVGHGNVERPFGVLTNVPLVWLALAVPLAWRGRSVETRAALRWALATVTLFFGMCTLTMGSYFGATTRYEVEFLPALVLLAMIGILSLERFLAPTSESGLACQTIWRLAARCVWVLLLSFSMVFNLLVSVERSAEAHYDLGNLLLHEGKKTEAIAQYEQALRLRPEYAEAHNSLGIGLERLGQTPQAVEQFEQAIRIKSDYSEAYNNLGSALDRLGRVQEAIIHCEEALHLKPDYAMAHNNLGVALGHAGKMEEAIAQYEQALRLKPDLAITHQNLGNALLQMGRLQEAMGHWEQALQIQPDNAEAHNNLGIALGRLGRVPEAVAHFERALQIKPDLVEAHYSLGVALEQAGKVEEAIAHYTQALQIRPDYAEAQKRLARLQAIH
jgi:tetratricopeptide (TPR) repeat protein